MDKKLKLGILTGVVFITIVILVIPTVLAEEGPNEIKTEGGQSYPWFKNKIGMVKYVLRHRLPLMHLLRNGVPTEIEGQIIALEGQNLIVSYDNMVLNIIVPGKWFEEGSVYKAQELLDGDPFGSGDLVSIKTLKVEIDKADTHDVTLYLAYSITFENMEASAILPFNIET